jgi:hypothetical protein
MKWAAVAIAAMLYLVWPYYTLLELTEAIRTADAPAIKRLVDWDQLRPNLKAQLQSRFQTSPKTASERDFEKSNPGFTAVGNALALAFANSLIDSMVTPEGVVGLIQSKATPPNAGTRQANLWQRTRFAFFVSPIHFRLDLSDPDSGGAAGAQPTLTVMLTFKGTGWQVSDLRVSDLDDLSSKMALAHK